MTKTAARNWALGVLWAWSACAVALPYGTARKNYLALDAGMVATNLVDRIDAVAADESQVSRYAVYVRGRRGFHLGKGFFLEPSLGAFVPWFSGIDGNTKWFTFSTDFPLVVPVFSFLALRAGPGVQWNLLTSTAGQVELGNGTATSTFYTPAGTRLSLVATVRAGIEIRFSRALSFTADVTVQSVASRLRRSFDVAAGLGVYL